MLEVLVIDNGGTDNTVKIDQNCEGLYLDIFKAVHRSNEV